MTIAEFIDIDILMDAADNNSELAAELLHLFFKLNDPEFVKLQQAVTDGDAAGVSSVAHKCAGSCSTCGMTGLSDMLRNLEEQAAMGMPFDIEMQLKQIQDQLQAIRLEAENIKLQV